MSGPDREDVRRANPLEVVVPQLVGDSLHGNGGEPTVRCPFHDDQQPSLRINTKKQVWRCDPCDIGGDVFAFVQRHRDCDFKGALSWLALRVGMDAVAPGVVAEYGYRHEDGTLLFQVVRLDPKGFRQRRPDGQGGFIWNIKGVRRVLYRLPELRRKPAVCIAEGEKDTDALIGVGVPATTCVGGAGKWRAEYAQQLKDAGVERVAILPDNDDAGQAHAESVARSCAGAGLEVRIVVLPDLPPKGDVSDWLDAGHTKDELLVLLRSVPAYETAHTPKPSSGFHLTLLRDLLAEPEEVVSWLVEDRIPAGGLALLAGKPKAGKSTMTRDLAFAVSRGSAWLGWKTTPGAVWYLALEDKRSEVRRHFQRMGATGDEPISVFTGRTTEALLPELHAAAAEQRPALIIVDTMQRLIQARDLNDYAEVTRKLEPMLHLARETGAAVVLVHHAGKSKRADIDSVLGSTALTGSVDTLLVLKRSDRYRTVATIQRVGVDVPQTVVSLDEESGRVSSGPTREAADQGTLQTAIVEVLRAATEPLPEKDISAVEGKTTTKRRALRQLVEDGTVVRDGGGKRNDPYLYSAPVSCSLVPGICGEQENKKPKTDASSGNDDTYSRSRLVDVGVSRSHDVSPDPPQTQAGPNPLVSPDGLTPFVAETVSHDADEEVL